MPMRVAQVDLLFTDVVMPGSLRSGEPARRYLAARIRQVLDQKPTDKQR
ncbi:hypothetical protein [Ramlibacter sp.]|nr:hypothetical protein [Ramlibacter sp.]MBA2675815.1 hypothetical protein [Ramlibacter sp.]